MRFYQHQHRFYCGVDLHASSMHVCMVNHLPWATGREPDALDCAARRAADHHQDSGGSNACVAPAPSSA